MRFFRALLRDQRYCVHMVTTDATGNEDEMATYQITNTTSGADLGIYEADSADEAFLKMMADAGCPSATADDREYDVRVVEVEQSITVDTDTLNDGFNREALYSALRNEFGNSVEIIIKSTGAGTQINLADRYDASRRLHAIIVRLGF